MVTDFSVTSILSNEFVVIGRARPKSERNDIELVSFHYCTRLDELIILAWSNVKNE